MNKVEYNELLLKRNNMDNVINEYEKLTVAKNSLLDAINKIGATSKVNKLVSGCVTIYLDKVEGLNLKIGKATREIMEAEIKEIDKKIEQLSYEE